MQIFDIVIDGEQEAELTSRIRVVLMRMISSHSLMVVAMMLFVAAPASAQILFEDDFDDVSDNRWHVGGDGQIELKPYFGDKALRMTKRGYALAAVKVEGRVVVRIEVFLAASNLESGDFCIAEASADGGAIWSDILRIGDGDDEDESWRQGLADVAMPGEMSTLALRLRAESNSNTDVCWADNISVSVDRAVVD